MIRTLFIFTILLFCLIEFNLHFLLNELLILKKIVNFYIQKLTIFTKNYNNKELPGHVFGYIFFLGLSSEYNNFFKSPDGHKRKKRGKID